MVTKRIAVLDLGSNAARLAVFEMTAGGGLSQLHWERRPARLAEGQSGSGGRLAAQAMARAIDALRELAAVSRGLGLEPIAVTTSAVRDAENGEDFVWQVRSSLGLQLRVLSTREEAYYSYLAVTKSLGLTEGLIVEVGGGSAQFMAVAGGRLERWASLPLGAVRMLQQWPLGDPPRAEERQALRTALAVRLAPIAEWALATAGGQPVGQLVGISGALRDLVCLSATEGAPPGRLSSLPAAQYRDLLEQVAAWTIAERIAQAGMEPHRADLVVPALELFRLVLDRTGYPAITVSRVGIREGLAYEFFGASR